jgi:hypothetical protein
LLERSLASGPTSTGGKPLPSEGNTFRA